MNKIIRAFSPLLAFASQSFTFRRGTEFAGFMTLEEGIGARIWFCVPSALWQKGAVETANERIRRFMPGNSDLAAVSHHDLIHARHLNDQPRKCLARPLPRCSWLICKKEGDPLPRNAGMMQLDELLHTTSIVKEDCD